MCAMPMEAREGELLMTVNHLTWVLGTEHRSYVAAANACITK